LGAERKKQKGIKRGGGPIKGRGVLDVTLNHRGSRGGESDQPWVRKTKKKTLKKKNQMQVGGTFPRKEILGKKWKQKQKVKRRTQKTKDRKKNKAFPGGPPAEKEK